MRKIEVGAANGQLIAAGCRGAGITEQTFYRWRREYGGLNVERAKRLKTLELENTRLKNSEAVRLMNKLFLMSTQRMETTGEHGARHHGIDGRS